jgi:uncharacterized protein (TIGR03437 family)
VRHTVSLFLLIYSTLSCQAQIRQLVTTDSGDQLYFSSVLGVRDTESLPYSKIMRWSADRGFEILAQRPNLGNQGTGLSSPYQLSYPNVSADGSLVTFAGDRDCYIAFKVGCLIPNPPETTFLRGDSDTRADGRYQLSPNGRFALRLLFKGSDLTYTLIDLNSGASADLPRSINVFVYQALTNDGRVLFGSRGALHLWSPDNDRQFPLDFSPSSQIVSADGKFIIYTRVEASANSFISTLYSLATETGATTKLPGNSRSPSISADGTFLTFLAPVDGLSGLQMFVARPDASDVWQITSDTAGVREAVISGDGRIVWRVSDNNSILRYDINSGDTQEISPRLAYTFQDYTVMAPGSVVTIRGTGLSEGTAQATYPLPESLAGARVEIDGVPLLIVSAEPTKIVAQIPFEMKPGNKNPNLGGPQGQLVTIPVRLIVPEFLPLWPNGGSNGFALHDDLKRMVTIGDAARPGELIHFLLVGLGQVSPAVQSGVPAPSQPELRVLRPFQVVLRGSREEVINMEVVKAILIPGTIGMYDVGVRVPGAGVLTPDVNGYFMGSIAFEPGDPLVGTFQIPFGQVPIKLGAGN